MNAQNPKTARMMKKRLSEEQVRLLEASFDAGRKLEPERKFQLARDLGVPPRQVAIWYQNKRARWKSQSLELDHGAIQVRLDAALAEKRELEREVSSLRAELKRAHDALLGFTQAQACGGSVPPVSSLSSCCDEGGGSSSLDGDVGCSGNWPNVEELYACLMAKGPVAEVVNERDYWV